nr:TPA_asm: non-structural polyprotein [Colobanthus quitensis dicistro-like virus 2]
MANLIESTASTQESPNVRHSVNIFDINREEQRQLSFQRWALEQQVQKIREEIPGCSFSAQRSTSEPWGVKRFTTKPMRLEETRDFLSEIPDAHRITTLDRIIIELIGSKKWDLVEGALGSPVWPDGYKAVDYSRLIGAYRHLVPDWDPRVISDLWVYHDNERDKGLRLDFLESHPNDPDWCIMLHGQQVAEPLRRPTYRGEPISEFTPFEEVIDRAPYYCTRSVVAAEQHNPYWKDYAKRRARGHFLRKQEERDARVKRVSCVRPISPPKVRVQSSLEPGLSARDIRDLMQKKKALEKKEAVRKSVPKSSREKAVSIARSEAINRKIETQGGRDIAAASLITLGITYTGKKLINAMQKMFGKFDGRFETVISRMDDQIGSVTSIVKEFLTTIQRHLVSVFGTRFWTVPLLMALFFFSRKGDGQTMDKVLLVLGALTPFLAAPLVDVVAEFFRKGDIQTQSGFEAPSKLLSGLMVASLFGSKCKDQVGEFMKRAANVDRCASGISTLMNWTLEAIQSILDFVAKQFGKEAIQIRSDSHAVLKEWVRRVDAAEAESVCAEGILNSKLPNKYISMYKEGSGFLELYRADKTVHHHITSSMLKLKKLLLPLTCGLNARNNFRPEPVFILMRGAPGIGKTLITSYFCAHVLKTSGILGENPSADEVLNNMWQKGASDFWNGYIGQECLIMDDALQSKVSVSDKENDYMNVIHAIGSWAYPLNFADLESKGKIYFSSKFVFATTNVTSIYSEADKVISCPEAFTRRIAHPYELKLRPEYADSHGRLDMVRYASESREAVKLNKGFPWHMWTCVKHDYYSGQNLSEECDLLELVQRVSDEVKARAESFGIASADLRNFVENVHTQGGLRLLGAAAIGQTLVSCAFVPLNQYLDSLEGTDRLVLRTVVPLAIKTFCKIGMGLAAYKAFQLTMSMFFGERIKAQSNHQVTRAQKITEKQAFLQSGSDDIANLAYANSFKIFVHRANGAVRTLGQITVVNDNLAVMPLHYDSDLEALLQGGESKSTVMRLVNVRNPNFEIKCSVGAFMDFPRWAREDLDLAFVALKLTRACRNISKSFIQERDLRHVGGYAVRLDVCELRSGDPSDASRAIHFSPRVRVVNGIYNGRFKMQRSFEYEAKTQAGDCGAVLSLSDAPSFQGRVLMGIHVAATSNGDRAYAAIVTQELIRNAREQLFTVDDVALDDVERITQSGVVLDSSNDGPFSDMGSFLPIGILSKGPVICPKSSYYKTEHYGVFGPYSHLPAVLAPVIRDGIKVFPMLNAVKPYSSEVRYFEQDWISQVMYVAMRPLSSLTKYDPRVLYTFEESVLGIPERKFRSIPRDTAAGFPYTYYVKNGKRAFFGYSDSYELDGEECIKLRSRVEHVLSEAGEGRRLMHVFVDFPKDELRKPEKIEAVATRLISSAPLDYVVAFRMMFGAFTSSVMMKHTVSGMAPGICSFSEWHQVVNVLHRHGEEVFAGDFKEFDSSEQPCIHDCILDFINDWYDDGPRNRLIRRVLWLELTHSRHVGGYGNDQRYVYQWAKSLPSGHPATTIVNSMYSLFCIVAAYFKTTGDVVGFWEKASAVTYGDDNVVGAGAVGDLFNQTSVAKVLKDEFGMTYTSDDKTSGLGTVVQIQETTFLKRGFHFEKGRVLCPLSLDSFLYTVYWCKNRMLEKTIFVSVLENALQELSLHPQHVWDEHAGKVYALLSAHYQPACKCEKRDYLRLVQSRTDSWF